MNNPPRRLRGGPVIPSGLGRSPKGDGRSGYLCPWRGLVIATRLYDDDDNQRKRIVECDVILIAQNQTLYDVPVMQGHHGFSNTGPLWQPKAASRLPDDPSTPLNLTRHRSHRGQNIGEPSRYSSTDGEMVIVEFLEGDPTMPVITGAFPHQRSRRRIVKGEGWREGDLSSQGEMREGEFYFHHQGTEVRINEQGDFLVDTVRAHADEDEDPSTGGGQIRFRVKGPNRFTVAMHMPDAGGGAGSMVDVFEVWKDGDQMRIDLGEGATEQLILGNAFMDFLNNYLRTQYGTHTHPIPMGGSTGVPSVPATEMTTALLSRLSRTQP